MEPVHSKKDADYCLWYIKKHICFDAVLIGSFSKGALYSNKDIDIYLPKFLPTGIDINYRTNKLKAKLIYLLDAESVELTDWGGWFFHNTIFGNVDVFFNIDDFDY